MSKQFPLKLSRARRPSFRNFLGKDNNKALAALERLVTRSEANSIYLWGNACGKTHLLLAASNAVDEAGSPAMCCSSSAVTLP